MRPKDRARANALRKRLDSYAATIRTLPGAESDAARATYIEQLIESLRRTEYAKMLASSHVSIVRTDARSIAFDPIRAAIFWARDGDFDEACWLIFNFVHFGKHSRTGWKLVRDIYGGLGYDRFWTWRRVSKDPSAFREWLRDNQATLRHSRNRGMFGNHRKYETIDSDSPASTANVFGSYVAWIKAANNHSELFKRARAKANSDPGKMFDVLYCSMEAVQRFGRTARFDYLTMLGKVDLATVEPAIPYLVEATGPLRGANLMFTGATASNLSVSDLEERVVDLGKRLGVGMQPMEDSLCNWQKSPESMLRFRG